MPCNSPTPSQCSCDICGETFDKVWKKYIHMQSHETEENNSNSHENISPCKKCGENFSRRGQKLIHIRSHSNSQKSENSSPDDFSPTPIDECDYSSQKKMRYECPDCHKICKTREVYVRHRGIAHKIQTGGAENERFWQDEAGNDIPGLRDIYLKHSHEIHLIDYEGENHLEYNYPVENDFLTYQDLQLYLTNIYDRMNGEAFKINLAFGFILKHIEKNEWSYYHPLITDPLLSSPEVVSNAQQLNQLIEKIRDMDLIENVSLRRPDTKWSFWRITNVQFWVDKIGYPLGANIFLPSYIKNKRSIIGLETNKSRNLLVKDNKCLFRCLALHQGANIQQLEPPHSDFI